MITFTVLLIMALIFIIGVLLFTAVIGGSFIVLFGDAMICAGLIYLIVKLVKKIQERKGSDS